MSEQKGGNIVKKMLAVLMAFILLFSCAYAESEITFHSIPWLSDDVSTLKLLKEAGIISEDYKESTLNSETGSYIVPNEIINYKPELNMQYADVCLSISLAGSVRGKIAGCPVKNVVLSYAYNGSLQLIAVKVELIGTNYESLETKLAKVYGEGEKIETEDGVTTSVWKGENNTAILLYSEGYNYSLIYGRLDAQEILSKCLEEDVEDVSGL